jgi:hypothetical protein
LILDIRPVKTCVSNIKYPVSNIAFVF